MSLTDKVRIFQGVAVISTITEDIMRSKTRNIATLGYGTMDKQI